MRYATLIAAALLAACAPRDGSPARADSATAAAGDMADMPGMEHMPGMALDADSAQPIAMTSRQASLSGVTFAIARTAPIERTVRAVATAMSSERGQVLVNARVGGWVERLLANETGRFVRRGEPLLELYAPELVSAQEELRLAARLPVAAGRDSLVASARRRLSLWDISADQVERLERTGTVQRRLTIGAPASGHLVEKDVLEGQMVRPGDRLFKIVDLSTIWVEPAVFETDIALIRIGQTAEITFDALPGRTFNGRITFLHPALDPNTRTLRVRVEVPNADGAIRPMMYGMVRIRAAGPTGVTVPLQAILPTGTRNLAFVVRQRGIVPVEVIVGARGDSTVVVAQGIAPGDTVVASSAFLFDSESQLAEAMKGIMLNMGMGLDMGGMKMEGMEGMDMPGTADSMPGMQMPAPTTRSPERRP